MALVVFGNQYAFNNPQALEESIMNDLGVGQTQYDMLYTIFALPNIVATFIIGMLIDFLGVRTGIIALSAAVAFFQTLIAIGGYCGSYSTILVGRMCFGIASESLITAQASMVALWFAGKELSLALGIAITFPEMGNALNSYLTPILYEYSHGLGLPFLVSVAICIFSFLCALTVAYLDFLADRHDRSLIVIADEVEEEKKTSTNERGRHSSAFWLVIALSMFAVSSYVPFLDNANHLFIIRFGFTQQSAGRVLIAVYIVAATCSAPLGFLVDRIGHRRHFIMGAMVVFTAAHTVLLILPESTGSGVGLATLACAMLGLGYSLYANCIVSSIPLVANRKTIGFAFGIMQMIESISLSLLPLISAALVEEGQTRAIGYEYSSFFFVVVGSLGIFASTILLCVSDDIKKRLDLPSNPRESENQSTVVITPNDTKQGMTNEIYLSQMHL